MASKNGFSRCYCLLTCKKVFLVVFVVVFVLFVCFCFFNLLCVLIFFPSVLLYWLRWQSIWHSAWDFVNSELAWRRQTGISVAARAGRPEPAMMCGCRHFKSHMSSCLDARALRPDLRRGQVSPAPVTDGTAAVRAELSCYCTVSLTQTLSVFSRSASIFKLSHKMRALRALMSAW